MKRQLVLVIMVFLTLFPFKAEGQEQTERVIAVFKEKVDKQIIEKYAMDVHYIFEQSPAVSMTIAASQKPELLAEKEIVRVDPDSIVKTVGQLTDWGYDQVLAGQSRAFGFTGKGIKIGIIDTGVSTTHPDLKVAGGVSFVAGEESYHDEEGHGTHVAGIIAALDNSIGTVGMAPDAEIYAIKSLNQLGEGNQSDVIAGIEWAIEHKLDIVNLSFTAPEGSYLLNETIKKAYNDGMILIAASGNTLKQLPADTDVLFPARYPEVIAVGAIDQNKQKAAFSYFGKDLDFVAPGVKVYSTYNGLVDGAVQEYAYMNGTSMAAPYVTGIAALYKQAYPKRSNREIRELMQQAAVDLGIPGKDDLYGYGLVQAPMMKEEQALGFPDIQETAWYKEEVNYLTENDIITGYPDGKFYPNEPVTRAEAITMIGKATGLGGDLRPTNFKDVPADFFAAGYIRNAVDAHIVTGFPNGTFQPRSAIIRGDVAVMLQKAFGYEPGAEKMFQDVPEGKYYGAAIRSLIANHITEGYPDGTFRPSLNITRAEFSVLLARALDEGFK